MNNNEELNKNIDQLEDTFKAKFDELRKEVDKFIEDNAVKLREISEQLKGKSNEE